MKYDRLLKRDLTQVFSSEYYEILRTAFFLEHPRWLLLKVTKVVGKMLQCCICYICSEE